MTLPLIGITSVRSYEKDGRLRDGIKSEYAQAVINGGGVPVLIPLSVMESGDEDLLRSIYQRLDGFLLPGGGDVHPVFFGEALSNYINGMDRLRDRLEIKLAQWAYEDDRPMLGICRGHQVLNVALGGSLMHDIRYELARQQPTGKGVVLQHDRPDRRFKIVHEVEICPGTRLSNIFGQSELPVNSIHHQAVRQLASPFVETAYAPDGVLEGFEVNGARFFLGVQWHPEALLKSSSSMQPLFEAFINACKK